MDECMRYNCDSVRHLSDSRDGRSALTVCRESLCSFISMFAPQSAAGYLFLTLSSSVAAVTSEIIWDIVNLRCFMGRK